MICRIPLMRRKEVVAHATVDAADFDRLSLHRWGVIRVHRTSYAIRYDYRDKKVTAVLMHREVMGLGGGRKIQVDHLDFDGLNNQRANLRVVTHAENCQHNRPSRVNTSGHVGVCFCAGTGRWVATLTRNGRRVLNNNFATLEQAVAAREAAVLQHAEAQTA